ncbi:MAG: two component transcriptional regulator [Rhodospirillales bacterium]|nr:two component transcriptional regulator [Rhodospirillales bacterium]
MQKTPPRLIAVLADDDALARALGEHLTAESGWSVRSVQPGAPPPVGALLIADTDAGLTLTPGPGLPLPVPLRLATLIARIEAEFAPDQRGRSVGAFTFDPADRALTHELTGATVRLTELENSILQRLVEADGEVVEREKLLADVWGYSADANTHTVETHVWRLRQKLGDEAAELLVTDGGGYRLAA